MASYYHVYISPKQGITREEIEKKLSIAIDWFRYDNKCWILYTTSDAKKWYSRLQAFVEPGGYLLIHKLDPSDYWGFMSKHLWDWIKKDKDKKQ